LSDKIKKKDTLTTRFISFIIRLVLRLNGGLEVKGLVHVPPQGGVLVAPNHISYIDPPLMASILPRRTTFMARKGLFSIPLLGWFIGHYAFPVDREKTGPSSIKNAVRRLKNGGLLVVFPEGRRSDTGKLLEGKRGVGMIASLGNAVIVPALITGTNKALPPGGKWLRRAEISVTFGNPIDTSAFTGKGEPLYEDITRTIMDKIMELKEKNENNRC
jgi:1-acyl-sn-glycerol-3-phosphate acyltransferase